jgi:hypothetical protein
MDSTGHGRDTTLLPNELIDNIVKHLHNDRRSLQVCSLVSRTFLHSCRPHLYGTIRLRPCERKWDPDLRKETIMSFLTILPFVRSLTVDWDDGDTSFPGDNGVVFDILPAIFTHGVVHNHVSIFSVTHLWLRLYPRGKTSVEPFVSTLLGSTGVSFVTELNLEHCTIPSINVLAGAAASCTALEKLTLHNIYWAPGTSTSHSLPQLTFPLRTFGYHGVYKYNSHSSTLFQWISSQDHLPIVDPLSLDIDLIQVPAVTSLIANLGENINALRIAFRRNDNAIGMLIRDLLHPELHSLPTVHFYVFDCLRFASMLQSLHIVLPHTMDIDSDKAIEHLIGILTPSNLSQSLRILIIKFSFDLDERHRLPSSKWIDLARLLLGFKQLETIRIKTYMAMGKSSERGLKVALEPFWSRGVLCLGGSDLSW